MPGRELLWNPDIEPSENRLRLVIPEDRRVWVSKSLLDDLATLVKGLNGEVVFSSQFKYSNGMEFSLGFPRESVVLQQEINEAIGYELGFAGVSIPETYDFDDLMEIPEPVVAKHASLQRGRGVYLLESTWQREGTSSI